MFFYFIIIYIYIILCIKIIFLFCNNRLGTDKLHGRNTFGQFCVISVCIIITTMGVDGYIYMECFVLFCFSVSVR